MNNPLPLPFMYIERYNALYIQRTSFTILYYIGKSLKLESLIQNYTFASSMNNKFISINFLNSI